MTQISTLSIKTLLRVAITGVGVCGIVIGSLAVSQSGGVKASQFDPRTLALASSTVSANTTYTISFNYPSAASVGSLRFDFCDNPLFTVACTPVAGLDVSGAVLSAQSGVTGYAIASTTANEVVLARAPGSIVPGAASYSISNVINPSFVGTFYVRISTHASTDGTGPRIDEGGAAGATATSLTTTAYVPPVLIFCVAVQFSAYDCSSGSGDFVGLGTLATTQPRFGTSEVMIATNAGDGYSITVDGITMSAGTQTIPALNVPTFSAPGSSQFGINFRSNTVPAVGQDQSGPGGVAAINAAYNTPNQFAYIPGSIVATSTLPTDYRKFTASYLVNVSPSQPSAVYATTMTYTATVTF